MMQAYDIMQPPPSKAVISIDAPILSLSEEQEKWLAEAIRAVSEKSALMQAIMKEASSGSSDVNNNNNKNNSDVKFKEVIAAAAAMFAELRTSMLYPHVYYELYIRVFDEVKHLQAYLEQEHDERGRSLESMYEAVQYTGHIVPRLYLLVTVGSLYMDRSREVNASEPVLEIARDLVEMCRGVQHPTRGLFLRHFLLTMSKDKLPGDMNRGVADDAARDGGTAVDTADLLVANFKEMVWLWVRMEARPFSKRQALEQSVYSTRRLFQDRKELRVLVGMNIVRISQLDGVDRKAYQQEVLPKLLSVILKYREPLAQHYLLEVIIQVFPDEFHLFTLDALLDGMRTLTATVDVGEVMRGLMDRLGNYIVGLGDPDAARCKEEEEVILNLFSIFLEKLQLMPISFDAKEPVLREIKRTNRIPPPSPLPLAAYVNIMTSLARLTNRINPDTCDVNISNIMFCIAEKFASVNQQQQQGEDGEEAAEEEKDEVAEGEEDAAHDSDTGAGKQRVITPQAYAAAEKLVVNTITGMKDFGRLLDMDGLPALIDLLPFSSRRAIALALVDAALSKLDGPSSIHTIDRVARVFDILNPLVSDQPDAPADIKLIYPSGNPDSELEEEQNSVCRVMQLMHHDDPIVYVKMLTGVRKLLSQGGARRMRLTFPTVASLYMRVALRLSAAMQAAEAQQEVNAAASTDEAASQDQDQEEEHHHHHQDPEQGLEEEEEQQQPDEGSADNTAESSSPPPPPSQKQKQKQKGGDVPQYGKHLEKVLRHLYSGDGKGLLELLATESPVSTFYHYLTCASVADTCNMKDTSYELYTETLSLYEQYAADTRDQLDMLTCLINSLYSLQNMSEENYEVIATKICQYCSKLVRKNDQSRMVALCANLFCKRGLSDEMQQRSVECLQRSLKTGGQAAAGQQLMLYVELLNIFLHFYAAKHNPLQVAYINRLIDLIRDVSEEQRLQREAAPAASPAKADSVPSRKKRSALMGSSDDEDEDKEAALGESESVVKLSSDTAAAAASSSAADGYDNARRIYRSTTKYIRSRQSVDPRWEEIEV